MPSFCAVIDCTNKYGQDQLFHKFPTKRKDLLQKWIEFTQRPSNWQPSKWMAVCGLHFLDEDYRSSEQKKLLKKTAVPTIRTVQSSNSPPDPHLNETDKSMEEEESTCDIGEASDKSTKMNCRLCTFVGTNFVSFAGNFEIFGMIQKCLPTLSIRQDDAMPKEICRNCLKRLEEFSNFIDKVLETQTILLRQFRYDKAPSKPSERYLKIKQEPVVRVKQENLDDLNSFFPDEIDDGCGEHDNDASNIDPQMEQKYQFCDFPVLNDQDIINNCDIMEIINLSDPFIDITNCENTIPEEEEQQQNQQAEAICEPLKQLPLVSAHDLLQSHLITEEHSYANISEGCKEEWQNRNCKTEKIDNDDLMNKENLIDTTYNESDNDIHLCSIEDWNNISSPEIAATMTVTTTYLPNRNDLLPNGEMERSNKPIVTSVSAINDTTVVSMPFTPSNNLCTTNETQTISRKKPNIVVLNESIVQSAQAFQLHACTLCPSKFFCIDSLNQHYSTAHTSNLTMSAQPMVSVPSENLTIWNKNCNQVLGSENHYYKVESDVEMENKQIGIRNITSNPTESQSERFCNGPLPSSKKSYKNEIKILDMQQTFPTQIYPYKEYSQISHAKNSNETSLTHHQQQDPQEMQDHSVKEFSEVTESHELNVIVNSPSHQKPTPQVQTKKAPRSRGGSCIKPQSYDCSQCEKVFPSLSSLNQHRITHTNLRQHQCNICQRIFKRRHGLSQHMRGYHMKLKPFECPTCKHKYALKGDMRRCGHSTLFCRKKSDKSTRNV